jgi:outer membrane protein OmpA-like peptidoglycan-associated protein
LSLFDLSHPNAIIMNPLILPTITVSALLLSCSSLRAQTAEPLDIAAAKAALSQQAKKPRFTPKSPIQSRTYKLTAKGAGVEVIEYAPANPGDAPVREERPYVAVPILFVVGKDQLLDSVSAANVQKTAGILRELLAADPKARFTIQGHTSAEGDLQANQQLSEDRARKIYSLLVEGQGLDATRLSQTGFGPAYAVAPPTAPESERQHDRRVLVVRQ